MADDLIQSVRDEVYRYPPVFTDRGTLLIDDPLRQIKENALTHTAGLPTLTLWREKEHTYTFGAREIAKQYGQTGGIVKAEMIRHNESVLHLHYRTTFLSRLISKIEHTALSAVRRYGTIRVNALGSLEEGSLDDLRNTLDTANSGSHGVSLSHALPWMLDFFRYLREAIRNNTLIFEQVL